MPHPIYSWTEWIPEAYLETCKTSMIELFRKTGQRKESK